MNVKNNFFFDRETFRRIDTFRIVYFVMFILSFTLTEIGRYVYRPYIYENKINDFGIADSMGNLGGIIVQIFFGLAFLNSTRIKGIRVIAFLVLGYIVYEAAQIILPKGVFDWKDVWGTLLGGTIALVMFLIIHKIIKRNRQICQI